jgi:hypothetical protein
MNFGLRFPADNRETEFVSIDVSKPGVKRKQGFVRCRYRVAELGRVWFEKYALRVGLYRALRCGRARNSLLGNTLVRGGVKDVDT